MKVVLLAMIVSTISAFGAQQEPAEPKSGDASVAASKETNEERQRRWEKAKEDLREKRMIAANAAIAAARQKTQQLQSEEAARHASEEADRLREQLRLDGIKRERMRAEAEEAAKTSAMAQAVADGVRSEYRRHVIKDWLQISGEIMGGLLVFSLAAVGIRRLSTQPNHKV